MNQRRKSRARFLACTAICSAAILATPARAQDTAESEYGLSDMYFGVPVVLGRNGIEKIIEVKLNDDEAAMMKKSADLVRGTMAALKF